MSTWFPRLIKVVNHDRKLVKSAQGITNTYTQITDELFMQKFGLLAPVGLWRP